MQWQGEDQSVWCYELLFLYRCEVGGACCSRDCVVFLSRDSGTCKTQHLTPSVTWFSSATYSLLSFSHSPSPYLFHLLLLPLPLSLPSSGPPSSPFLPPDHLMQYLPPHLTHMPNFPNITQGNPYLMTRTDSSIIDASCYKMEVRYQHMWQSRVEIEHYSIAYLSRSKCCSAELPLRAGLIRAAWMYGYLISLVANTSLTLNGSLRYSTLSAEKCNKIMFDFYLGLPHIQINA